MRRFIPTLCLMCALVALPGCGNEVDLKELSPPGRGFKVMMPGSLQEKSQNVAGTQFTMWLHEGGRNSGYMVGVADLPIPAGEPEAQIQQRLDGGVQSAVGSHKGSLTKAEKILLAGKHPGRSMEATFPQGQLRGRFYLVGTRMYQLMVIGSSGYVNSASANKFLDSLTLTP